jgi:CDP-6-deoxy-D-xylo-4-hexulose-3-dehydrase
VRGMFENKTERQAADAILDSVRAFHKSYGTRHKEFEPGDSIRYAGRVYDENELVNLVDSALEFWLTAGRYADVLEKKLKEYLGIKYCGLVNSGSSANLIAFMALTADELNERAIKRGDEVITVAAAFPTTVSPIVQYGANPVFVDIEIGTYNIDVSKLEGALSEKTKAVFIAHTLGNPFNLKAVKEFCDENNLWLIEDNCDALGAEYIIDGTRKKTGTVGDIGTSSFYPAHHMTTGEGGAVYTNNPLLHKIMMSFRDWGRDCVCPGGRDNLCGHRFDGQFGELPRGYDHKYVYSHFGYNLKMTEMQAAIGAAQVEKLPSFVEKRRFNFDYLLEKLSVASGALTLPVIESNAVPSWFGFPITVNDAETRVKLVSKLEGGMIQTRNLFSGNLLKHPCFDSMRKTGEGFRVAGGLENTDKTVTNTFWLGVYPGMTEPMLDHMAKVILDGID